MTGIHRLKHIEDLGPSHFSDDNSVRPHTQAVSDQIALGHFSLVFDVWGSRFQADNVSLFEMEFRGILDRDNPLIVGDKSRQDIEKSGFADPRPAGDQNVKS